MFFSHSQSGEDMLLGRGKAWRRALMGITGYLRIFSDPTTYSKLPHYDPASPKSKPLQIHLYRLARRQVPRVLDRLPTRRLDPEMALNIMRR